MRSATGLNVMKVIRIGTRGSQLALWQAHYVADLIAASNIKSDTEIVPIKTEGDQRQDVLLSEIGGKGMFIKELEVALLDNRIDIAVHSMKDLTVNLPEEFQIAAILERGNPYDAFVSTKYSSLADLPPGATIGTCSLRRQSQLLSVRNDLKILPIRGNVPTRLQRLDNGDFDAVILAVSGLRRLELADRITEILDRQPHIPSPGQGALGIECRSEDKELIEDLLVLDDRSSNVAVSAERAVNAGLGGNCHIPIGILAKKQGKLYEMSAYIGSVKTEKSIVATTRGYLDTLMERAVELVGQLNELGAQQLLRAN